MKIDDLFSSQVVEEKNKDEEQCHHDVMLISVVPTMRNKRVDSITIYNDYIVWHLHLLS